MEHRTATAEVEVYLQFMHALNWLINWFNAQFLGWAILRQGQAGNKYALFRYVDPKGRHLHFQNFCCFVGARGRGELVELKELLD